jgi:hypothetical protein
MPEEETTEDQHEALLDDIRRDVEYELWLQATDPESAQKHVAEGWVEESLAVARTEGISEKQIAQAKLDAAAVVKEKFKFHRLGQITETTNAMRTAEARRNEYIVAAREAGCTETEVALAASLSRQRIGQIVRNAKTA